MGGRRDLFQGRYGTSFEAKQWRALDVCGLCGITFSLGIHLFAFFTIAFFLIEGSLMANAVFVFFYIPVSFLAVWSLYMAWITDPGAVPMGARPLVTVKRASSGEISASGRRTRATRRCHKCNDNYKPNRAHHDSVTGRCIVKFDHFCPWVGNAVGALNHKFFVLFVGYTMCTCITTLVIMLLRAIHCGFTIGSERRLESFWNSERDEGHDEDGIYDRFLKSSNANNNKECEGWFSSMAVLILLVVSVVFLIFTCCMLFEQIEAIETNSSKIARMKMRVGQAGTELAPVTEEFNEMFGGATSKVAWHWFLPFHVEFPNGMKKIVLGYEWDETFDPVPYVEPHRDEEAGVVSESGSIIELTTPSPSAATAGLKKPPPSSLKKSPPSSTSSTSADMVTEQGEEGSFAGTPVMSEDKPKLTKRGSSKDRVTASTGTMT